MTERDTKYIKISYDMVPGMPVYVGNPPNRIEPVDTFEGGVSWTTFSITLFNHNGSHIDAPYHFDRKGKKISDYRMEEFIFNKPCLIDVPKGGDESIRAEDLARAANRDCDVLLIRTGFCRKRGDAAYVNDNPWLNPGAARHIRKEFEKIRAIVIDTISIGSHRHPAEAIDVHRILLQKGDYSSGPVLIMEDMNLGVINYSIERLFAIPLFASGVDSMLCTAFVEV